MKLIQRIMEDYNLTQQRLAQGCGVAQYRLSLLLNKNTSPSRTEKEKLERYFVTDTNILLGDIDGQGD